ncbi:hypothetical protein [Streptomyces sp. NPDC001530]|uniref:hypothetical protein n=1 Tax=Streptomyces sp. NPDC001530 TaxID=3364582 RepID=UPI0036CD6B5D
MTPEQIDAVANGLIGLHDAAGTYGPGIAITLAGGTALWGAGRIWQRLDARRQERRDRAKAWRQLCDDPPAVDTAWGNDSDDLLTCLQILNATETREGDTHG